MVLSAIHLGSQSAVLGGEIGIGMSRTNFDENSMAAEWSRYSSPFSEVEEEETKRCALINNQ